MNKIIFTITGPTCSGKSTLTKLMVDTGKFTEIVSTTTRIKRVGEVDGENYHFVTPNEFDEIEMLETVTFNGNSYGGSVAEFEDKFDSGLVPVIVVDPNGMFQINRNATEKGWTVVNMFIDCPTELQAQRFLERFTEDYRRLLGNGDMDDYCDLMTEYAGRMTTIIEVESGWVDQYLQGRTLEDNLYFNRFMHGDETEALSDVLEVLDTINA
jgi:guanylate kinase